MTARPHRRLDAVEAQLGEYVRRFVIAQKQQRFLERAELPGNFFSAASAGDTEAASAASAVCFTKSRRFKVDWFFMVVTVSVQQQH